MVTRGLDTAPPCPIHYQSSGILPTMKESFMLLGMGIWDLPWLVLRVAWWLKLPVDTHCVKISMHCGRIDFEPFFATLAANLKYNPSQRSGTQHKPTKA